MSSSEISTHHDTRTTLPHHLLSGYISGLETMVQTSQKKALTAHRRRLKRRGIARLEVRVREDDVALVRSVVDALSDPAREAETRALLRDHFGPRSRGLKALLAAAPLEGIELSRDRDLGRDIEL